MAQWLSIQGRKWSWRHQLWLKYKEIHCVTFPRMELLRIGHIDVEFTLNCVDFWIEFGIKLEYDLEVSNCTGVELMC